MKWSHMIWKKMKDLNKKMNKDWRKTEMKKATIKKSIKICPMRLNRTKKKIVCEND